LITHPGAIFGTPGFMAPELAAGRTEDVDARTDLWAVGATVFQLLTGTTVHLARSTNEALVLAATAPARRLSVAKPDTTPTLSTVIDRSLSFERAERWPNARAMQTQLFGIGPVAGTRVSVDLSGSTVPETVPAPIPRRLTPPNAKKLAYGAVLLLLLLALVLAAANVRPRTLPPPAEPRAAAVSAARVTEPPESPQITPVGPRTREAPVAPKSRNAKRRAGANPVAPAPSSQSALQAESWHVDDVLDLRK
jgi:serine/threonine-protein kinase